MNLSHIIKIILYCAVGVLFGAIIFFVTNGTAPIYYLGIVLFFLFIPFMVSNPEFVEKVLMALFLLTIPIIVDKTLGLRDEHKGGAKGFIISLHDIFLFLLMLTWLYRKFINNDRKISLFLKYSLPVLGVIVMATVSLYNAPDRLFGMNELVEIIKMLLVFLYMANYVKETGNIKFILFFLLLGLAIENVFVLLETMMGRALNMPFIGTRVVNDLDMPSLNRPHRVGGTLGGANGLGWYLTIILPLSFSMMFNQTTRMKKWAIIALFCFGFLSLILTFSRGAWIGFIVAAIIVLYFNIRHMDRVKRIFVILFCVVFIGTSLIVVMGTSNPIKDRITEDDRGSASSRLILMEVAFDMIKANPLIGVGLNNYILVHTEYDYGVDKVTQYYPVPVHNTLLQLAAEIGIPGLFFFLSFVFVVFGSGMIFVLKRKGLSTIIVTGIIAGMIGFLIDGLVENTSLGSYNFFPFWTLSGIAVGLIYQKKHQTQ